MRIIFASSEVAPFAQTGGLGDMVGSLPKTLRKLGHDPIIFMPKYKSVDYNKFDIKTTGVYIHVQMFGNPIEAEIYKTYIENDIPVYFIENNEFYYREGIYGSNSKDYYDNAERFTFFSKACICAIKELKISPDIIHCHDWPTGIIPLFLKTIYKDNKYLKKTGTMFTIHNVVYQGIYEAEKIKMMGLPWDIFNSEGIEFYGKINFLKAGIVFSDIITTVSKTYANEIQTQEFGAGLDGILRNRCNDLHGITNGVDYDIWNPDKDNLIIKCFSPTDLKGKVDCKRDILSFFGLEFKEDVPLIGMISRLDKQKGIDLLEEAIHDIVKMDIHLCILGIGDERFHKSLSEISEKYKEKVKLKIAFNNQLAHKIEAGADIFLMPSKYEPCGLNQLYSLKYGTIPVVRKTGGLADTIKEYDIESLSGNGFTFQEYSGKELLKALQRAVNIYKEKDSWMKLMQKAMNQDFSWQRSAYAYLELYNKLNKE